MTEIQTELQLTERRVCRALEQPRSTQRQAPIVTAFDSKVREEVVRLACQYGRYGYRRVTETMQKEGWRINHKRVARLWRQEGLKVPQKQPKRRRLWLNDGSCIRLRPEYKNHVWSYDFVADRTSNAKAYRMLTVLDEYSRKSLAIEVKRSLSSHDVIEVLARLFIERGLPDYIRSDNGSEFTAKIVRKWLERLGVQTLFIEPGSPWENGYIESFNGKLRDELLNGEIFDTLLEAKIIIERWRVYYNQKRPHSSLGYVPPAPQAILPFQGNQLALNQEFTNFKVGT